jgi:hypothetical protein
MFYRFTRPFLLQNAFKNSSKKSKKSINLKAKSCSLKFNSFSTVHSEEQKARLHTKSTFTVPTMMNGFSIPSRGNLEGGVHQALFAEMAHNVNGGMIHPSRNLNAISTFLADLGIQVFGESKDDGVCFSF